MGFFRFLKNGKNVEPKLKYEHTPFGLYLYESYTKKATGEKWVAKEIYDNVQIIRPDDTFDEIFKGDALEISLLNPQCENCDIAVFFQGNNIGFIGDPLLKTKICNYFNNRKEVHAAVQKIEGTTIFIRLFLCQKITNGKKPLGIPSGKVLKQMTISPVGITFECLKGDVNRQDVMYVLDEGNPVIVEKYSYKHKPAYMFINGLSGLDFGVMDHSTAEQIFKNYPNCKIEGYISKRDSFFPINDDMDDVDDVDSEEIETCRIKLYIVESNETL